MNQQGPVGTSDKVYAALNRLVAIVGAGNAVLPADSESFAEFLHDETYLKGEADLVLRPGSTSELQNLIENLNALRTEFPAERSTLSFTLRGGGSGLSGACVPAGGIVLDLTRINRILDVDLQNQIIHAECGVILSDLSAALAGTGLWYPVDPSSVALCTVGGSIATNAAGPSSLKYGTTRDYVARIEFIGAEGSVTTVGSLPVKTSMGFSIPDLICGSEGRLGIVTAAQLRLRRAPDDMVLVVGAFESEDAAVRCILSLRAAGISARCIEIIDAYSCSLVNFPLGPAAVLLIELDGTPETVSQDLARLMALNEAIDWISARDENSRRELWEKRRRITHELKRRFAFKLGEDVAVPLTHLAGVSAFARQQATACGIEVAIWGHAGDGNLHVNYLLDSIDRLPLLDNLMAELAAEVTRCGGAMSGEHGLGRLKRKYARAVLPAQYFNMQRSIKAAFDPTMIFNPALEID